MKGLVNNLLDQKLGVYVAFAATRGIFLNPSNASLRKANSPEAHRLGAAAKFSGNFLVEQSRCGHERDFGSQHQSSRSRTSACPAF